MIHCATCGLILWHIDAPCPVCLSGPSPMPVMTQSCPRRYEDSNDLLNRLRKPLGASSQDGTWRLSDERADEIILDRRAAVAVIIGQQRDIANLKTALRDLLATLGDTAIVPPEQLVAARDAIAKAEA